MEDDELQLTARDAINYLALINFSMDYSSKNKRRSGNVGNKCGKEAQLADQDYKCLDCKEPFIPESMGYELNGKIVYHYPTATKDHVIPYRYGSSHTGFNIVWLCHSCNNNRAKSENLKEIIESHFGKINWEDLPGKYVRNTEMKNLRKEMKVC